MKNLTDKIDKLISRRKLAWKREGNTVTVDLWSRGRKQKVRLERTEDMYVFTSIIAGTAFVTKSTKKWNDLAVRSWRKNALKDIVTFAFDSRERLVGVFEQPVATLDHEEVHLYIETLAKECDRFEYVLTGEDDK